METYQVGILCALPIEAAAVEATFDEELEAPKDVPSADGNSYCFGRIGKHRVVVACLPAGKTGKASAATVGRDVSRSFPNLRIGVLVGIGGGVPNSQNDIRLGDIVVSQPSGDHGGVIQWDYGKMEPSGFRRTGMLNKPPTELLSALSALQARHERPGRSLIGTHLRDIASKMGPRYDYQGVEHDRLYQASYEIGSSSTVACGGVNSQQSSKTAREVFREPRQDPHLPRVHYGNIASGDGIMRSGLTRDRIGAEMSALCFETEAAGLEDSFPCIVIRGIADYSDSHANKTWQRYAASAAASYAKEFLSLVRATELEVMKPVHQQEVSYFFPFDLSRVPRTEHYVDREEEMNALENFFRKEPSPRHRRSTFALHGMGGIGKTQLCAEFASRHKPQRGERTELFSSIFWLDCSTSSSLKQSIAHHARSLFSPVSRQEPPGTATDSSATIDTLIKRFLQWLSEAFNSRWLLILDNMDHDPADVSDPQGYNYEAYLPTADHGNVLLTTRLATLQLRGLHVQQVNELQARKLLLSRAKGRPLLNIEPLLEKLDGLPLALVQASSYLGKHPIAVVDYIRLYESEWARLMESQDKYPPMDYARRSISTTWNVSYEQVARNDCAAGILRFWAFLDHSDLWYGLFAAARKQTMDFPKPDWYWRTSKDEISFREAIGILVDYSMVTVSVAECRYSMHPVLHTWNSCRIRNYSERRLLFGLANSAVARIVPDEHTADYWLIERRLLPHAVFLACNMKLVEGKHGVSALLRIAWLLKDFHGTLESRQMFEWALHLHQLAHGVDDLEAVEILNGLALVYARTGMTSAAEDLFSRAVFALAKVKGESHPDTLSVKCNLATLYCGTKPAEAEKLCLQILSDQDVSCGVSHPRTLLTMLNLVQSYRRQGKLREAERTGQTCFQSHLRILGQDHPRTIDIMNSLALIAMDKGEHDAAESGFRKVLSSRIKSFGKEHQLTLDTIYNLARICHIRGNLHDAEKFYRQVLSGRRKKNSEETFDIELNLGMVLMKQARYEEAEPLLLRARKGYHTRLGPKHQKTLHVTKLIQDVHRKTLSGKPFTDYVDDECDTGPESGFSLRSSSSRAALGDQFSCEDNHSIVDSVLEARVEQTSVTPSAKRPRICTRMVTPDSRQDTATTRSENLIDVSDSQSAPTWNLAEDVTSTWPDIRDIQLHTPRNHSRKALLSLLSIFTLISVAWILVQLWIRLFKRPW